MPSCAPPLLACLCLCSACFTTAVADCSRPELANQRQDVATIQRLEREWSLAHLRGDVDFERCLLTEDFTEIMSNGAIHHLADELASVEKNKGKTVSNDLELPVPTVHMHGNVAVAYALSPPKQGSRRSYFVDYYVWRDGSWRVFFGQQTSFGE